MTRHKTRWVFVFPIMMIFALLAAWSMQTTEDTKRLLDNFELRHTGDIEATFHIRSTAGETLHRVGVSLTESRFRPAVGDDHEPEQFVVDSEITVKKRGVSAIYLTFFKDGFYDERWEYVMSERPPESLGKLQDIDVTISMAPHPTPAPLERHKGGLRADAKGPMSVFFPTNKRIPDGKPGNRDVSSLPPEDDSFPYLFLSATVVPGGELATRLFPLKSYSAPRPVLSQGFLRLAGASEGDGFLPVDIGEVPPVFERGFRYLLRAPDNDYSETLELVPVEGYERQFFYCRIGGLYGKGVVTNPPLILEKGDRDFAIASVILFINPTGSTDVSYIHY